MSTLPTPESDDADRLSDRERAVLDDIAGHENASDPGFVAALGPRRSPGGTEESGPLVPARHRDRVIQSAVVGGLVALVLPTAWLAVVVVTLLILVIPVTLAVHARQQQRRTGPEEGSGRDEP